MAGTDADGNFVDEADVLLIDPELHLGVNGGGAVDKVNAVAIFDDENVQVAAGRCVLRIGKLGQVHRERGVSARAKERARPRDLRKWL
mgnify:CR=1 FL=1